MIAHKLFICILPRYLYRGISDVTNLRKNGCTERLWTRIEGSYWASRELRTWGFECGVGCFCSTDLWSRIHYRKDVLGGVDEDLGSRPGSGFRRCLSNLLPRSSKTPQLQQDKLLWPRSRQEAICALLVRFPDFHLHYTIYVTFFEGCKKSLL